MAKIVIRPASEIVYPLRMLIYGTSGSGKTHLAMQANMVKEMAPALMLSGDWGTATARRTKILVSMLERPDQLDAIIADIKSGGKLAQFKTIIIDGLSQFYETIVLTKSTGNVPQIQDWLVTSFDAKGYIRDLVRLEKNVIVTCLDQLISEQASGTFYTAPLVPGKMAWRIAEAFDIVGHVEVRVRGAKVERYLRVQPSRRTIAKDRDGTIGKEKVDITWALDSGEVPPMALLWNRWTAYSRGEKPDVDQDLTGVKLEDDFLGVYAGEEVDGQETATEPEPETEGG